MTLEDLLFVGFNSRIAALDRLTGEIQWRWKSPKGSGYVSLLVDGEYVYASVNGYTYCLDAVTGVQLWTNEMTGFGMGVAALATTRGSSSPDHLGSAAAQQAAQRAAASS